MVRPVLEPARITSPYGYRTHPVTGQKGTFHYGIDYVTAADSGGDWSGDRSTIAMATGIVSYITTDYDHELRHTADHAAGKIIIIESLINKEVYRIRYLHLDTILVPLGYRAREGERIGIYGETGRVTGAHIHVDVYDAHWNRIDPRPFFIAGFTKTGLAIL